MRKLSSNVEHGIKAMFREDPMYESAITKIALNTGEPFKRILIRLEVHIHNGVTFPQQSALEDSSEKAGGACY